MTDFIYNPSQQDIVVNKYYGWKDSYDFIDDNDAPRINDPDSARILAKKIYQNNNHCTFLIRITQDNKPYNPMNTKNLDAKKYNFNTNLRNNISYKKVSSRAFDYYLKFLRSKNISWLHNTEREII